MRELSIGLFCEGQTDDRFLSTLIRRTTEEILTGSQTESIKLREVRVIDHFMQPKPSGGAEQILEAARLAYDCDILIVHKDADTQTHQEALQTRIDPGIQLIH